MKKLLTTVALALVLTLAPARAETEDTVEPVVQAFRQMLLALPDGTLDYALRVRRLQNPELAEKSMAEVMVLDIGKWMDDVMIRLQRFLQQRAGNRSEVLLQMLTIAEQEASEAAEAQPEPEPGQ